MALSTIQKSLKSDVDDIQKKYISSSDWIDNVDLNDFKHSGIYPLSTGLMNNPVNTGGWGILFVLAPRFDTHEQLYFHNTGLYWREFKNGSWKPWRTIISTQ